MRIGPVELQLKQHKDGSWEYRIYDLRQEGTLVHCGYRPTENQARQDGLEDAALIRQFCS